MLDSIPLRDRQAIEELSARREEPSWLLQQRLKAWRLYEDMLPPTGLEEDWRRMDLGVLKLAGVRLFPGAVTYFSAPSLRRTAKNGYDGEIIQGDGVALSRWLAIDLERQGVIFSDLQLAAQDHPELFRACFMTEAVQPAIWKLVALHAALWRGGIFLHVPAGVQVTVPLHAGIGFSGAGVALFPHTLIVAEEGSSVTLIEEHASPNSDRPALSSGVVEIVVRDDATVRYIGVQDWGKNVDSFSTIRAVLERGSSLELGLIGSGGHVTKDDVTATLRASGANAKIVGLFLAGGAQHMSYTTLQDHLAPNTTSDLLLKSVLRDSAHLVWNGLTRIHKGAAESDANQTSRNLLLGEGARVAPIPVLEIEAHDVARCSHGVTVSSVDEEQLYYMMSRGLTREDATQAIIEGFLRQGLESLTPVQRHVRLGRELERRLLTKAA
jgi:Fe-S cluster assembly protein SufD